MNKNKSFTLIELLVVIVIIGILAGVIMISTSSSIDKANIAKVKVFEESIQNNLAANMVSAWDADHVTKDTTWTLNDKWGNNNGTFYDGTVTACSSSACPQIVNDKQMGNVLSFDGVNDYIDCGKHGDFDLYDNFSVGVWIYQNSLLGSQNGIVEKGVTAGYSGWSLLQAGGVYRFFAAKTDGSLVTITTDAILNQWVYLFISKDDNKIYLYKNGVLADSKDFSTNVRSNSLSLKIGKYEYFNTENMFKGMINDVRIYNAALSSAQIKQNYIAGLNSMLANGNISKKEYNKRINTLAYEQE